MKFEINFFRSLLSENLQSIELEFFEEIDSTNTYILKKNDFYDKILVISNYQTAGRGRFNRKWVSNRGENLIFSIGLKEINLSELQKFSFITPLAVQEAIEKELNLPLKIKWPNDLIYESKKVCGILIESQVQSNEKAKVVVGIGINVNQIEFPDEIKERSTSLKLLLNTEINREILLSKIISLFFDYFNSMSKNFKGIYKQYKNKCTGIGQKISVILTDKIYTGVLYDININGELELLVDDKKLSFKSGEITLLKE